MKDDRRLKGEAVKQFIKNNFKPHLDCAHFILNTAISITDESNLLGDISLSQQVITVLHTKAITTFQAIITLCEEGFDKDAITLVRSLMEIDFMVTCILKGDAEDISKYYIYCELLQREKYRNTNIKNLDESQLEKTKESLEKLKREVPDEDKKYIEKDNPFNKSIRYIAEKAGKTDRYDIFYRYFSFYPHSTPASLNKYLKGNMDNSLKLKPGRAFEKIEEALRYGCILYMEVLERWCSHLSLDREEKRRKPMREQYTSVFEKKDLTR